MQSSGAQRALGGFWTLTRFEDVVDVTRRQELYVSSVQNVVPAVVTVGERPLRHPHMEHGGTTHVR